MKFNTGIANSGFSSSDKWVSTEEGWISVEDRLPEDIKVVLCYSEFYNKVFMGYTKYEVRASSIILFVDVNSLQVGDNKLEVTTHWQPLPEPPEEKKKEEECKHDLKLVADSVGNRFECQKEGCDYYHN